MSEERNLMRALAAEKELEETKERLDKYIQMEEKLGWPGSSQVFDENVHLKEAMAKIYNLLLHINDDVVADSILIICKEASNGNWHELSMKFHAQNLELTELRKELQKTQERLGNQIIRTELLEATLMECATTFREYAFQHAAKADLARKMKGHGLETIAYEVRDREEKMRKNQALADMCFKAFKATSGTIKGSENG